MVSGSQGYEAAGQPSRRVNYGALGFMIAEGLLFGIPLGSIAFRNVLVANGAFSAWCPGAETECHAQEVAIAQFTQLVVAFSSLGNLFVEPLVHLLGPNGTARLLVALFGCGLAFCGVDLRAGWSYAVGMIVVAVSASAMVNLNIGTFFGAATEGASTDVVNFWITNITVCIDIGFVLAVVAAGIAGWTVLPLAWWFVVFGVVIAAALLAWFETSVKLRVASGDQAGGAAAVAEPAQAPPPRSFRSLLKDRAFLVATAQFAWSVVFFNSIEAASARIARYFDLDRGASFYAPVAVSIGSVFLLFWAQSRWNAMPRPSGFLRLTLAGVFALLFGTPAFRHPASYYAGYLIGGAWRSASMAAAINLVYTAGAGGTEIRAYAFMTILSTVLNVTFGQLVTWATGTSAAALSAVMLVAPIGAFGWETLSPLLTAAAPEKR